MKSVHLAFHFVWMSFFGENPICNTVKDPNHNFDSLNYSQESLVAFFFTKIFRNGLHTILSVGFRIFWFKTADSPKNDFISSFFSFVLVFLCRPRASFYRSAIFSALSQKRTNKYITNPFWGSGRKLTR